MFDLFSHVTQTVSDNSPVKLCGANSHVPGPRYYITDYTVKGGAMTLTGHIVKGATTLTGHIVKVP